MGFTLPHWAEICTVQRFGVETRLWCPSVHFAVLFSEEINSCSAGGIYPVVTKHCPFSTFSDTVPLSPPFLQAQGSPGDKASPAPDAWISLLYPIYPITISSAPVWSLLLAELLSGGLLCSALDLCQAIQLVVFRVCLLSGLSSTWLLWIWAGLKYRAISILCVPLRVSCW